MSYTLALTVQKVNKKAFSFRARASVLIFTIWIWYAKKLVDTSSPLPLSTSSAAAFL